MSMTLNLLRDAVQGGLQPDPSGWVPEESSWIIRPMDLPSSAEIPAHWVEWLQCQESGNAIDWDQTAWRFLKDQLPSVWFALQYQCLGVAVLIRPDRDPVLAYIYRHILESGESDFYSAIAGGKTVAAGRRFADTLTVSDLPDGLMRFYTEVHDGWESLYGSEGGPRSIGRVRRQGDYIAFRGLLRGSDHIVDADQLLRMCNYGFGDYICVDMDSVQAGRSHFGVVWNHEEPSKSLAGIDYWVEQDSIVRNLMSTCFLRPDRVFSGMKIAVSSPGDRSRSGTITHVNLGSGEVTVVPEGPANEPALTLKSDRLLPYCS
jgi:hypothetical protein